MQPLIRASRLGVAVVVLSSCGPQVHSTILSSTTYPPKPADAPIVLFMTKVPTCPYEEIGTVTVSEGAFAGGENTFGPAMMKRARKMGGDAVVGFQRGSRTGGLVQVAPGVVVATEEASRTGVVIRFKRSDCTS